MTIYTHLKQNTFVLGLLLKQLMLASSQVTTALPVITVVIYIMINSY